MTERIALETSATPSMRDRALRIGKLLKGSGLIWALIILCVTASLISPFVGRLDDINEDGMIVIRELAEIFALHDIESEVLAASIRHPLHVTQAALAGAHISTLPFKVLQQMVHHPLTDKGIVQFRRDWEAVQTRPTGARLTGG